MDVQVGSLFRVVVDKGWRGRFFNGIFLTQPWYMYRLKISCLREFLGEGVCERKGVDESSKRTWVQGKAKKTNMQLNHRLVNHQLLLTVINCKKAGCHSCGNGEYTEESSERDPQSFLTFQVLRQIVIDSVIREEMELSGGWNPGSGEGQNEWSAIGISWSRQKDRTRYRIERVRRSASYFD